MYRYGTLQPYNLHPKVLILFFYYLNISECKFNYIGLASFLGTMKSNVTLKTLILNGNKIYHKQFSKAISGLNSMTIKTLGFSNCELNSAKIEKCSFGRSF